MSISKEKIGLIAGEGTLPCIFIQEASLKNVSVVTVSISRKTAKLIKKQGLAEKTYRIDIGQINTIIQTLVNEKIKKVVMLGKVIKANIFTGFYLDDRAKQIIKKISNFQDCSFMDIIIHELESDGLTVLNQTEYLTSLLTQKSILTKRIPLENEWEDIHYGLKIAKEIANMDIGQTIVVKNQTVVCVEALEGTDATIVRSGKIIGSDGVVVKVSRPSQDLRYDIPAVGLTTLKSMKKAKSKILAIEANKTLLIDKENLIEFADKNNICIVAEE